MWKSDRDRLWRPGAILAAFFGSLLALHPLPSVAQESGLVMPETAARHFILLLDDSGDSPLRPGSQRDPAGVIAESLFAPIDNGPGFDYTRDLLSVVFFQVIGSRPAGCFAGRPFMSLSPEGMFELARPPLGVRSSPERMAAYLRLEIARTVEQGGCRFAKGGYSPIERSRRLVLPFLDRHDRVGVGVGKIYLIQASNRRTNPLGDVSDETNTSAVQFENQGESDALHRQVDEAVSLSRLESRGPIERLYVDRFRVTPKLSGETLGEAFSAPDTVELRRRAVSQERIRIDGVNGEVRIRASGRLVPLRLSLRTDTPPRSVAIDLETCAAPCKVAGRERVVDVARAMLPAGDLPAGSPLEAVRVLAEGRFRYAMPGLYGNLVIDSTERPIQLQPEVPLVVPRSFAIWEPLQIDNETLASAWKPSDVHGLDQATAARRIVTGRSTWAAVYVLAALFLVLITAYLLLTHRGFHPALALTPRADPIDFNSTIPEEIERWQLRIFNAATAHFVNLQRNPSGPWSLVLNDDLSAVWRDSDGAPAEGVDVSALLHLRPEGEHASTERTKRNSGRRDFSAVLVLDGNQMAAIQPPPRWDGGPTILRLSGKLTLESRRSVVDYPFADDIELIPERPASPRLADQATQAVEWRAGEPLELGSLILSSDSRYRFAVPADVRHRFELRNDQGVLYAEERQVRIEGYAEEIIPLVAPEGATPNPTHPREEWSLLQYLDNQQPIDVKVSVGRDISGPEAHLSVRFGTAAPIELTWCEDQPRAQQHGRPVEIIDGHRVLIPESDQRIQVGRHDAALVLCSVTLRLGKPSLGGQLEGTLEGDLLIGEEDSVPLTVRSDHADSAGGKTLMVTGATPSNATVSVFHAQAFDLLHEQGVIERSCIVRVAFSVTVVTDEQAANHRATILIPCQLVRREHGTILAIDFGNSAIAVATLPPAAGEADVRRLQEVPLLGERTLANEDPENAESGSCLIPSAFTIEFDRRGGSNGGRPGTHWGPMPEILDGSDPRTISLPALSAHYTHYPERVVQSIKHIIASDFAEMAIAPPITTGRHSLQTLEVDKLVTGVMKALAETYVGADEFERLVFTVPNNFLPWQEKRVRNAIASAFTSAIPEWTRSLSESDAVLYRYVGNLPKGSRREVVLFYDFGSGTIDLTLASLNIDESAKSARIHARLGFDRAGSYLDGALTRIVHDKVEAALGQAAEKVYRFPLDGGAASLGVANFASELARAKRQWSAGEPLKISQHYDAATIVDPDGWRLLVEAGLAGVVNESGIETKCLLVDWNAIHSDPRISQFFEFVRNELVSECLRRAGMSRQDVTTVVISGRGALWPGFIETLKATFTSIVDVRRISKDLDDEMKLAVVRGAAMWLQQRSSMIIEDAVPEPTYLAITDLNRKQGSWAHIHKLGTEPIRLPAGELSLAVIDFDYDPRTLGAMLRHPFGRWLVRTLPFDHPVERGQVVTASLAKEHGRTVVRIDNDGFATEVGAGGRVWPVGDWSAWNRSQFGEEL